MARPSVTTGASTTSLPDIETCRHLGLSVTAAHGDGRAALTKILDPGSSIEVLPEDLRSRWRTGSDSSMQLGSYETIYLSGSTERQLQASTGPSDDPLRFTMLAPIDSQGRIRSVALSTRRVDGRLSAPDLLEVSAATSQLVEALGQSNARPLAGCVHDQLRTIATEETPASVNAMLRVEDMPDLEFRVLTIEGIVWVTASHS